MYGFKRKGRKRASTELGKKKKKKRKKKKRDIRKKLMGKIRK